MAKQTYEKGYSMRKAGGGVESAIPKLVVEKAARKASLTLDEFIKQFEVIHLFNDFQEFDGAYRFRRREKAPDKRGE